MATTTKNQSMIYRRLSTKPRPPKGSAPLQSGAAGSKRNDYIERQAYTRSFVELRTWLNKILLLNPGLKDIHTPHDLDVYFASNPNRTLRSQRDRLIQAMEAVGQIGGYKGIQAVTKRNNEHDSEEVTSDSESLRPTEATAENAASITLETTNESETSPAEIISPSITQSSEKTDAAQASEQGKQSENAVEQAHQEQTVENETNPSSLPIVSEAVVVASTAATQETTAETTMQTATQRGRTAVGAKGSKVEQQKEAAQFANSFSQSASVTNTPEKTAPQTTSPLPPVGTSQKVGKIEIRPIPNTPRSKEEKPLPHIEKNSHWQNMGRDALAGIKDTVEKREKRDNVFNKKRAEVHEIYAAKISDKAQLSHDIEIWNSLAARAPELAYATSKDDFDKKRERYNSQHEKRLEIPYNAWIYFQASHRLKEVEALEAEEKDKLAEVDKEEAETPMQTTSARAELPHVEQPILANDVVFRQEYLTKVEKQVQDAQKQAGGKLSLSEVQTRRSQFMSQALREFAIAYPSRAKFYAPYHEGLRRILAQQNAPTNLKQEVRPVQTSSNVMVSPETTAAINAANVTHLKSIIEQSKIYPGQLQRNRLINTGAAVLASQPFASNYSQAPASTEGSGGTDGGNSDNNGNRNTTKGSTKQNTPRQQKQRRTPPANPLASVLKPVSFINRIWLAIPFLGIFIFILLMTTILVILGGGSGVDNANAGADNGNSSDNTPQVTITKSASSDKSDGSTGSISNGGTITYTITVTPNSDASEIDVTDPLTFTISGKPTDVTPADYSYTSNTLTWKLQNVSAGSAQTISFTVRPTATNTQVYNQANATINGASAAGGNVVANSNNCAGKRPDGLPTYALTALNGDIIPLPNKNFGDPSCDFSTDQLISLINQNDAANLTRWLQIADTESTLSSGYGPNAYLKDSTSQGDNCGSLGAFGLYQLNAQGHCTEPGTTDMAGDVDWREQTLNAISFNKRFDGGCFGANGWINDLVDPKSGHPYLAPPPGC